MTQYWMTSIVLGLGCIMGTFAQDTMDSPQKRLERNIEAWQDLKFGFFTHWGAYSQWGCIESWPLVEVDTWARPDDLAAWVERNKDFKRFQEDYWKLNSTFNPQHFDPTDWVNPVKYAGMRYFVFTTKHHDGFCMYDTKLTDYRVTGPDCPFHTNPRANAALEVFNAFRREGFRIGAYYSKADWHSPYYWSPDFPAPKRTCNYDIKQYPDKWAKFVEFVHGQIEELMTEYGRIDILWLDAGQVQPPNEDIQMDRLVAMARSHQPNLIVVDRTAGTEHENYRTPEQEVPEEPLDYPWETCMTMGDQWSYKPNDNYKSTNKLIHLLVDIVAKGGNFLLNVGPQPDGRLPREAVQRLIEIGDWMRINGNAIYSTRPIPPYKEGRVCLTRYKNDVYAILLLEEGETRLPATIQLSGIVPEADSKIEMLGASGADLTWSVDGNSLTIAIPKDLQSSPPCPHACAMRIKIGK